MAKPADISDDALLTIGFFNDFRGGPTILMHGPNPALKRFSHELWSLADAPGATVDVSELDYARVCGSLTLIVECAASYQDARGLVFAPDGAQTDFLWLLEGEMLREAAEKIEAMLRPPEHPCHQYLAIEKLEEAQVMIARGEYDPAIFRSAV
ncbi:MAG: hypothetical protein JXQ73_31380 [Phycisphaerae bacterium]|nr:hypothetical protein [Phycisphaerae bacterium]